MDSGFYLGKEAIELKSSFFELPYVRQALSGLSDDHMKLLNTLNVNAVHQDHVALLPEIFTNHGSSERTNNEIYTLGEDRVLCF